MAFYGKEYQFQRQENFDGFLKSVGLSEDKIQEYLKFNPSQIITKNGDTYSLTAKTTSGDKVKTFKSGVEFDDTVGAESKPTKNVITVEGNKFTEVLKSDKGTATFKKEFNGDELIVTITSSFWDGVARRYYKA